MAGRRRRKQKRRQTGSGKFHMGFNVLFQDGRYGVPLNAASGALSIGTQMCNNSYVAVMSAQGCGQFLKTHLACRVADCVAIAVGKVH